VACASDDLEAIEEFEMADIIGADQPDSRRGVWARMAGIRSSLLLMVLAASTIGCSSPERDVHEAVNSRDTGPYISVGRTLAPDGTLLVHVVAERPANAEEISRRIVRQNYAASPPSIRVVVDPAGAGTRQVFRWDPHGFRADASSEGLPPTPPARRHGLRPGQ
jgi:hypothetical protein